MKRMLMLGVSLIALLVIQPAPSVEARDDADRDARPYLYFTPDGLADFRKKLKREPFKSRWNKLVAEADKFVGAPLSDARVAGGDRARPAEGLIDTCAIVYAVTGDRKYGERAKAEAWAILEQDAWHRDRGWNKGAELPTGECSIACARFYDWCHDLMTEAEREWFVERAVELGIKPYLASVEKHRPARTDLWVDNYVTNWCGVCHGGGGLLGLALYDESPEAKRAAGHAWKYLPEFLDHVILEDGGGHEGVMYWRYGVQYAFKFVTAYEHVMGEELKVSTEERMAGYWDIYMHGPDRRYANFNDMNEDTYKGLWAEDPRDYEGGPSGALNALFEARTEDGDPLLLWGADNGGGSPRTGGLSTDWFLWRRDVPPAGDKPALQPNVLFRGAGHAILSGDRLWLVCNGGWISDKSHANNDLGTFVMTMDGERFVHDPGYNKNHTNEHSTVTIDGEPQPKGSSRGKFVAFEEGRGFSYFTVDLGGCYGGKAKRATRTVIMAGDYVVIVDDFETTGTDDIDWRLQTKCEVEEQDDGAMFKGRGELHIVHATPVSLSVGDTDGGLKHLSARMRDPGRQALFVSVLHPDRRPRVEWKVKGSKGTLRVNGDKHEFAKTNAGWLPRRIKGRKVDRPEEPGDRILKRAEK